MDPKIKASKNAVADRICDKCGHKVRDLNMFLDVRCWCDGVFYPLFLVLGENDEKVIVRIDSV
jgi:hypothetical protein